MALKIVVLVIGILVFAGGIYYLIREKNDAESRKIYTITSVVGALIAIGAVLALLLL